jgi:hypothetical protein
VPEEAAVVGYKFATTNDSGKDIIMSFVKAKVINSQSVLLSWNIWKSHSAEQHYTDGKHPAYVSTICVLRTPEAIAVHCVRYGSKAIAVLAGQALVDYETTLFRAMKSFESIQLGGADPEAQHLRPCRGNAQRDYCV